jgi:hypothetical protein
MILELLLKHLKDIVLTLVGLVGGGIVSLFFYRRALQRREISYATDVDRLIWSRGSAFSDIKLLYKGRKLFDPRKTIYYVWNSGNCVLNASDVASGNPLSIGGSNVRILSAEIASTTREVIRARLDRRSNSEVILDFDFLDPSDGFIVELFYDVDISNKEAARVPRLRGTLKGSQEPPVSRDVSFQSSLLNRLGRSISLLGAFLLAIALLIFQGYEIGSEPTWLLIVPKVLTALLLALAAIGVLVAFIYSWRAYRIPIELKADRHKGPLPLTYTEMTEMLDRVNERDISKIHDLEERITEVESKNLGVKAAESAG